MTVEELLAGVVIPIDKPRQWTSFQTVNKVKSAIRNHYGLKKFKIGHAGTLDPLATGLLLVCVGRATKEIAQLQAVEKVYTGTMVLGATTPCYDLERPIDHYYPYSHITPALLEEVKQQFIGDIQQVPPIFSAVKIAGQRAYEYARADDPSAIPEAKTVHVERFEITAFRPGLSDPSDLSNPNPQLSTEGRRPSVEPTLNSQPKVGDRQWSQLSTPNAPHCYNNPVEHIPDHLPQLDFHIRCGKGTYIRSIARDMGVALHSGAFLSTLRRESIGIYTVQQALELEQVDNFLSR